MRNLKVTHEAIIENVSRRNLLKGILGTGGLVIAAQFLPRNAMADGSSVYAYKTGAEGMPGGTVYDPHVFVSIAKDGTVTIVTHRSEMGTGSRTSLPMVVADEMEADWSRVKIVQAPRLKMVLYEVGGNFRQIYTAGRKLPGEITLPAGIGY